MATALHTARPRDPWLRACCLLNKHTKLLLVDSSLSLLHANEIVLHINTHDHVNVAHLRGHDLLPVSPTYQQTKPGVTAFSDSRPRNGPFLRS